MTPAEEGSPNSPLIILAEAPHRSELRLGRPLIGPSGEVFKDCLHSAGLARGECYILNVWPFMIEKDKKGNFFAPDGTRVWGSKTGFTEAGLAAAQPTLERIRRSGATTILTFGQQACALATGKIDKIMKWRGSILEGLDRVGYKKVVPTIHPAATLHGTYLWRYNIIADMRRAAAESRSAELHLPERDLMVRPTLASTLEFMRICARERRFATDLEVINNQVSCFSLCYDPRVTLTVPFMDEGGGHYWSLEDEQRIWQAYAQLMEDPRITKVNQNLIGFDAPFLATQNAIYTAGPMQDCMIAQSILYPEFPMGLDYIASIHTREPYYKDEGKMWKVKDFRKWDFRTFWRYCGKDAAVALEAWDALAVEMTERGYWPTYRMTADLAQPLMYMTVRGVRVDRARLAETNERVGVELAKLKARLAEIADINPLSPPQCMKYFYETKGITPYLNKDGKPTSDDKAMSRIYRRFNLPEAKLVQEVRAMHKLKNTYLEVAFDADGRLRCSWNPRGTWTGRLSSSQTVFGTGMNLQNLAPEFKGFIVADPDEELGDD
jgi:uracil-DNA glycosylase